MPRLIYVKELLYFDLHPVCDGVITVEHNYNLSGIQNNSLKLASMLATCTVFAHLIFAYT